MWCISVGHCLPSGATAQTHGTNASAEHSARQFSWLRAQLHSVVWGLGLPRHAAADGGLVCGSDPGSGCAAVEKVSLLGRVRFGTAPAGRWSSPGIESQLLFFFPPPISKGYSS